MSTTNPVNVTTEWEDLQVKYGNWQKRPDVITNESISQKTIDAAEQIDPLAGASLKTLQKLEDDIEEDVLDKYRRQRLEELKQKKQEYRFGYVTQVQKAEYVEQVTDASKAEGGNQWVILCLYKDALQSCKVMNEILTVLARKFGYVKFCRAVSDDIVENFPAANLPGLMIYRGGVCRHQIFGPTNFGGRNMTADSVEWSLAKKYKIFHDSTLVSDPLETESKTTRSGKVRVRMGRTDDSEDSGADEIDRIAMGRDHQSSSEEEDERNEARMHRGVQERKDDRTYGSSKLDTMAQFLNK